MRIEIHRHPGTPDNVDTTETTTRRAIQRADEPIRRRPIDIVPESASRVVVREVFNGLTAITADGETMAFTMRDSGFEIAYQCGENVVHVDLQRGEVHHSDQAAEPLLGYATNRQLIEELQARWSMGSTHPDYSTMTADRFGTDEYTTGEFTVAATPAPRRMACATGCRSALTGLRHHTAPARAAMLVELPHLPRKADRMRLTDEQCADGVLTREDMDR